MASNRQTSEDEEPVRRRNILPPELVQILWPALQVGGAAGASGITIGAFAGVIKSSTPALFAMASGLQWFTLGSTFWASRGFILHAWDTPSKPTTPQNRISASALAGALSGVCGSLLRTSFLPPGVPRSPIIPGAIMFALFGAGGQALYNRADASHSEQASIDLGMGEKDGKSWKGSWLDSKWSPMKVLSDKEYEHMLQEKLLKVNAEIALVDESIEGLRLQEKDFVAREKERMKKEEEQKKSSSKK